MLLDSEQEAGCGFPAMPVPLPGRCHGLSTTFYPWPSHLRWLEEKSPTADGATYAGRPIQALCPCHMSLTLVFWLRHFKTSFSCGWEKKRKGVRKSWHSLSLLKFSERASNKRRTRLRANKSRAPPQKAAVHPYSFPHHFPHKILWPPRRNVCKESACPKAICNFTK